MLENLKFAPLHKYQECCEFCALKPIRSMADEVSNIGCHWCVLFLIRNSSISTLWGASDGASSRFLIRWHYSPPGILSTFFSYGDVFSGRLVVPLSRKLHYRQLNSLENSISFEITHKLSRNFRKRPSHQSICLIYPIHSPIFTVNFNELLELKDANETTIIFNFSRKRFFLILNRQFQFQAFRANLIRKTKYMD